MDGIAEVLKVFLVAAIVGCIAWAIAYIVPFLKAYRNQIGIAALLIVLVLWLLGVLGVSLD